MERNLAEYRSSEILYGKYFGVIAEIMHIF